MIETRVLGDEVFIVSREGRREQLLTPADAVAMHRSSIDTHQHELRNLADSAENIRAEIERACFFSEPTNELRQQLSDVQRQAQQVQGVIAGHRNQIEDILAAVNRHQSDRLAREHAGHLAALVAPFDRVLQECRP